MGRSLRAQMKYADKLNCKYTLVLGETEAKNLSASVKNMKTGEQTEVEFSSLAGFLKGEN